MPKYIICPVCKNEFNYIIEGEEACSACKAEGVRNMPISAPIGRVIETDFSSIKFGHNYGTNSREIYEKFCGTLGWDKRQVNQFGWQTWMYAEKADTDRTRDVWFIFHSNYTGSVCDTARWLNEIKGSHIFEIYADEFPKPSITDRIVFAKNKFSGYEFLGVYKIIKTTDEGRIYERISENYPIKG